MFWKNTKRHPEGVVCIVTSERYNAMALEVAKSVREFHADIPIQVFTDDVDFFSGPGIDFLSKIRNPHWRSKVDCLNLSLFERTLFLDADTQLIAPVRDGFELLDRFDIALAHAHKLNSTSTHAIYKKHLRASFPQFNSGVIFYKNCGATRKLFKDWQNVFQEANLPKDQVTHRELLWSSPIRIATLPSEYNIRYRKYLDVWDRREALPRILNLKELKK